MRAGFRLYPQLASFCCAAAGCHLGHVIAQWLVMSPWTVLVQIPEIASNLFVLFSSLLPGRVRAGAMSVFWFYVLWFG